MASKTQQVAEQIMDAAESSGDPATRLSLIMAKLKELGAVSKFKRNLPKPKAELQDVPESELDEPTHNATEEGALAEPRG